MRRIIFILSAIVIAAAINVVNEKSALAGPWTPDAGHGYAKVWTKWHLGLEYQDGAEVKHHYGGYHEVFLNAYAEIGLTDRLAFWLHAPLLRIFTLKNVRSGEFETFAFAGDPTFGLRWRFYQSGALVVAAPETH